MKTYIRFILIFTINILFFHCSFSQTNNCNALIFNYDQLGNRILRQLIVEPCLDEITDDDDGNNGAKLGRENENEINQQVVNYRVYPNPTDNVLYIETSEANNLISLQLYDIQGKLVLKKQCNSQRNSIDIQYLASGTYMLHIKGEMGDKIFKITKR